MRWIRVFLADHDLATAREYLEQAIAAADQQANFASLTKIQQLGSWKKKRQSGFLSAIVLPSLSRAVEKSMQMEMHRELHNTGLAARRFSLRTGRLPASLDELVSARVLDRIPPDLYSGAPILMKVTEEEVVLYSVGENGSDDQGDDRKDLIFRVGKKPLWEIDAPQSGGRSSRRIR